MISVLVAESSAVNRSVIKEIIVRSKKLSWMDEVSSYNSLKTSISQKKPNVIITDKALFDADRNSSLSDYCHSSEIPTVIFINPGEKVYYSSKNIKFLDRPEFINFSSAKLDEYATYLEQQVMDIKCNLLLENHPSSVIATVNEDGSLVSQLNSVPQDFNDRKFKAVLVGVSTGGPGALLDLLKGIGKDFPLPIFITQHIDSIFDKNLITWLSSEAKLPVQLAENNVKPVPGHVYFAPSDEHLTFIPYPEDDYHMILNHDAPVNFLRPAVDKMFESGAKVFGKNCIAVILTGMGADGAKECLHLKNLGAYTITQDEASSVIYGMPKAAYEMGGSCEVLPLNQIPQRLWSLTGE
ncbi:MAG: chemotaxis protein CheB [Treponema sp.]|nr:chemotaxis protein CheB [Treponema sp.]